MKVNDRVTAPHEQPNISLRGQANFQGKNGNRVNTGQLSVLKKNQYGNEAIKVWGCMASPYEWQCKKPPENNH